MDTYRDMILKMFKSGIGIDSLTETIYYQLREKEKTKQSSERVKYTKWDAKKIVEQTILDDMKTKYI